jgi:N-methylhydantoinase A/acetophenone carboxylase
VLPLSPHDPSGAWKKNRGAFWGPDVGWLDTSVYSLVDLRPGNRIEGPAIIEAPDTTIVLDPSRSFRIDERGNGIIEGSI